jgi:hypothetical protein
MAILSQLNKSRNRFLLAMLLIPRARAEEKGKDFVVKPERGLSNDLPESLASRGHHLSRGIREKLQQRG